MAGPTVLTGQTLTAGIRSDFWNSYQTTYSGVLAQLATAMRLDVPSDKRTEIYGARRTMPYPERWIQGDPIPTEGTDSVQFSVTNFQYGKRIQWHRNDRMDNLVGDLFGEARVLGSNFASLPSRLFVEVLTNSASLLPAIPTCPDGAALFATTAGGVARFGVTSGNLLTGSGVTTVAQIQTDFYAGLEQFASFQNTKGEPFFEPDVNDMSILVYAAVADAKIFSEAFNSHLVHSVVSSTGAAISNVILNSGVPVEFRFTSRLATGDWYMIRKDAPVKSIFLQRREPLREAVATEENSDQSRDTGVEYIQFVERLGIGVTDPYAMIKIDN